MTGKQLTFSFTISGAVMLFLFPFFGIMTGFMHDDPMVSEKVELFRRFLAYTWLSGPVIWILCLALAVIEFKNGNKKQRITLYKRIAWFAWGPHLLVWILWFGVENLGS